MPQFMYTAREQSGQTKSGVLEATSAEVIVSLLRQQELMILDIKRISSYSSWLKFLSPSSWRRPKSVDVEISLNQLALMLRSGLSLLMALYLIEEYTANKRLAKIYKKVSEQIQEGQSLHEALSQHKVFSHLVVELVDIGEQTGELAKVLNQASKTLEKRRHLKGDLISALIYPFVLVILGIGVVVFLMVFLVPKLEQALASLSSEMPPMTQNLIDLSNWFQDNIASLIAVAFSLIVFVGMLALWPQSRLWRDRLILKIPLVGQVIKLSLTINFTRCYRLLFSSGVPIGQAIATVRNLLPNHEAQRVMENSHQQIFQGKELSQTLENQICFMPLVPKMIAVGETSGNMDEVLDELSNFHENMLSTLIKRLSVLLEPIIIIVLGGLVGYVYLSFFMAVYSVQGGIK